MYYRRQMEKAILKASEEFPVVMVCGQRQVGKSTMLRQLSDGDRTYVTFDDAKARNLAKKDPALFFETYGYKLFIDEFQYVPEILSEIKRIVDEKTYSKEKVNGTFWLSGSQKFVMMKHVTESLAGRVAVFNLLPLSQREIDGNVDEPFRPDVESIRERSKTDRTTSEVFKLIFRGGMPRIVSDGVDRDLYFSSYMDTYIERDISRIENIGKLDEFRDFVTYMAANTAQELKYDSISKAIGVSAPTVKEWVSVLERSGIIYILRTYSPNFSKRLVKTPKCYFIDTGLAAYLTSWPTPETLMNGNAAGAFFETYVVGELLKGYANAARDPRLFYYRDVDKKEIDLLMEEGDAVYPLEIKKGKNPSNAGKNFSVLEKYKKTVKPGLILCMADELFPVSRDLWYCPISLI